MARKNTRKNTRRQGRPVGYVPPRLAAVKVAYEGDGVRITNLPQAVDYLELIDTTSESIGQSPLLSRPIYRFTEAAFDEALRTLHERGGFSLNDLPSTEGVAMWDDPAIGNYCGFAWAVESGNLLTIRALDSQRPTNPVVIAHAVAGDDLPEIALVLHHTHILIRGVHQSAPEIVLGFVLALLNRIIEGASGDSIITSTMAEVRGHSTNVSRPVRYYDVRSTPEENAARRERNGGGTHASPSYSFWRKGHQRRTRSGEIVDIPGTWCCTDKPRIAERPRITGTTIRERVAA